VARTRPLQQLRHAFWADLLREIQHGYGLGPQAALEATQRLLERYGRKVHARTLARVRRARLGGPYDDPLWGNLDVGAFLDRAAAGTPQCGSVYLDILPEVRAWWFIQPRQPTTEQGARAGILSDLGDLVKAFGTRALTRAEQQRFRRLRAQLRRLPQDAWQRPPLPPGVCAPRRRPGRPAKTT
jgi:hypothetical protein